MDKEYIRDIFEQKRRDDRLIKYGDLIDEETIKILSMASRANIDKAFYQYTRSEISSSKAIYRICFKCPKCGKLQIKEENKADVLDIVKRIKMNDYDRYADDMKKYLCEDCYIDYLKEKEDEKKKRLDEKEKLTSNYINQYLSPDRSFKKDIKPYEKINSIMKPPKYRMRYAPMQPYYDEIENRIKTMNYHDFLETPFWDGVRNYKLKKANYCCELCGGKGVLNVHHKTYENHGKEFDMDIADGDLIVLCKNCHEKFHDKLGDKEAC